jgi:hypothetical protein
VRGSEIMSRWTESEIHILVENYNKVTNDVLAKLFPDKTSLAIYKKAYKLGLRKTSDIEFANRSNAKRGERSNFWNGGVSMTTKGYKAIKNPSHPRANSKGYVLEHILIFERETGIPVPQGCCVHHINGNKTDNRIENLCMMTHSAHTAMHNKERGKSA